MNWFFSFLLILNLQQETSLENFIWKNRIFIFSGNEDFSVWRSEKLDQELAERKLLYFYFQNEELVHTNYVGNFKNEFIQKNMDFIMNSGHTWGLIGLDGDLKYSGTILPGPQEIFNKIDAMPMRKSELVKRNNQDNSLNK